MTDPGLLSHSRFRAEPIPKSNRRRVGRVPVNQYQSAIDAPSSLPHSSVMESRQASAAIERSLVSVVDDDESVRESLPDLLREFGFAAQAFSSAEEFLTSNYVDKTKCLILDVAMPGMSGHDLQRELKLRRKEIPIVFITARKDETIRPRLIELGAVDCLFKPFSDTSLLAALNVALRVN